MSMLARHICKITVIFTVVITLSGCDKFTRQERENLTPFANQTITLVSTLDYGLSDNEYLYLRKIEDYVEGDKPFERFVALENQVGNQLKALVAYSIEMVRISEQPVSDNEKSRRLADILVQLSDLTSKDQVVPPEKSASDYDELRQQVYASEDYLDSLRILVPLIDDFTAHALRVVDELENEKRKVIILLEHAIDNKYGTVIAFENEMRLVKNTYYKTAIALARYAKTRDEKYIAEMRELGMLPVVRIVKGKHKLSSSEMLLIHKTINDRMSAINDNYNYLKPDYDAYYTSHQELKNITDSKERGIKDARLTFIVWRRAYQKMASGRTEPAEWFDITESGSLLMGAAGRAVGL